MGPTRCRYRATPALTSHWFSSSSPPRETLGSGWAHIWVLLENACMLNFISETAHNRPDEVDAKCDYDERDPRWFADLARSGRPYRNYSSGLTVVLHPAARRMYHPTHQHKLPSHCQVHCSPSGFSGLGVALDQGRGEVCPLPHGVRENGPDTSDGPDGKCVGADKSKAQLAGWQGQVNLRGL